MSELQKLIKAVEAGDEKGMMQCLFDGENCGKVEKAFHGSLDAAAVLHRALLPGWRWDCGDYDEVCHATVSTDNPARIVRAVSISPARAWLRAILKAYAEQETGHD